MYFFGKTKENHIGVAVRETLRCTQTDMLLLLHKITSKFKYLNSKSRTLAYTKRISYRILKFHNACAPDY